MDIRKRLAALDRLSRKPDPGQGSGSDQAAQVGFSEDHLKDKLQLFPVETKAGLVWVRNYIDQLPFPSGDLPDLREVMTGAHLAKPALEEIFFMDTETTGLAGGTGTLAFLIGCSWFRAGQFHTRQFFLPGPGLESAILQEIERISAGFAVIMTFNGGSFDLPLLRTRALMNRVSDPLANLVSWDLLMAGRRLWGRQLDNCRQQTLEREVCGLKRTGADIDGALIPQIWFDFVASGNTLDLEKVLYHNHCDMIGMGTLFGKVVAQISSLQLGSTGDKSNTWQECWSLGRICEKRKQQASAEYWLMAAIDEKQTLTKVSEQIEPLFQDCIRILKRSGDWVLVREIIERAFQLGINEPWLFREAAILFEHRQVDLSLALVYALQAEDMHRVERLQRKLL